MEASVAELSGEIRDDDPEHTVPSYLSEEKMAEYRARAGERLGPVASEAEIERHDEKSQRGDFVPEDYVGV